MAILCRIGGTVILSAAKNLVGAPGLARWQGRFFATLRMTGIQTLQFSCKYRRLG